MRPAPDDPGLSRRGRAIAVINDEADLSPDNIDWFSSSLKELTTEALYRGMHPLHVLRLMRIEFNNIVEEAHGDRDAIDELIDADLDGLDLEAVWQSIGTERPTPQPRWGDEPRLEGVGLE